MNLPVRPPVAPMLAELARGLPGDGFLYEPKWDGFRCLAFCDGDAVDLRSRHDRPLARYFPEVVECLRGFRGVLDGELLVPGDFSALLARLHPAASRVERLRRSCARWPSTTSTATLPPSGPLRRWRPDREPRSCRLEQLARP